MALSKPKGYEEKKAIARERLKASIERKSEALRGKEKVDKT